MAWQAAAAGVTAAYNIYNFDQQYNNGRLANFVRNRRRRNPSNMLPRGMGPFFKRRRGNDGPSVVEGPGAAYVNDRHHKRRRTLGRVNIRKLAKEGTAAVYDRWQLMNSYGLTSIRNLVLHKEGTVSNQDGTANANLLGYPYYMWDLTAVRNVVSGNENVPDCAFQLVKSTVNNSFYWNLLRGQNITTGALGVDKGTAGYQWYKTPKAELYGDAPYDSAILDWVNVQAVFHGSKRCSHKIWMEVVQIEPSAQPDNQLNYLPAAALSSGPLTMGKDEGGQYTAAGAGSQAHYTNMMARLTDGPFATALYGTRKMRERVLDRKCIEFSPVASFEENGTPLVHKQTINFFLKMGRKVNYAWQENDWNAANILGDNNIETEVDRGSHSVLVHPNARVFFRVFSQTYNKVGDDAIFANPNDCSPSFDIRISRKFIVSQ